MKNLNKILALVLALMMLISVVVVVPASAAEVTYDEKALDRLVKLKIYQGKADGDKVDLAPEDDVTREQMAMFVARVMTGKVASDAWVGFQNDTPFKDIADRPALNIAAIAYAYDQGIIIGKSADIYDPKGNVTYQEALTMVVRALLGYNATKDLKYPAGFINAAIEMGLTDGISGVEYKEKAIRGVTATILYNALTVSFREYTWAGWWPTVSTNTFAKKFKLTSGKYMLTSVTEMRADMLGNESEFTQAFPGTNKCEDGDYVVFTALKDDVTFEQYEDKNGNMQNVDRFILATELANDLGADLTKKIGYVYDLTFEGEKLAWVDEYTGTTYQDYGKVKNEIAVAGDYLVVDGQKYDQVLAGHANDEVKAESVNPTKLYDLRLFEYNATAETTDVTFNRLTNVAALKNNMFQEVTMFDTNRDGMYDYAIYMPYYIGNYITGNIDVKQDANGVIGKNGTQLYNDKGAKIQVKGFIMPGSSADTPYAFQYANYFSQTPAAVLADWNFSQVPTAYSNYNIYKVNPVSKDITIIETISREANKGEVTKVVNDAITGEIISATVGGKVFENIDILTDANLYGLSGFLSFEQTERMPTALRTTPIIGQWHSVFETVLKSGLYKDMRVYSVGGVTIYGWPSIVRSYDFVAFDWMDANFSIENDSVLVVDHALTDASGNYTTVKINAIDNRQPTDVNYDNYHTFDGMEFEAFCDAIDALYTDADLNQYNMYFNDVQRAAIMATGEYETALRTNIMEEINGATGAIEPELYVVYGQDANGNLILADAHDYATLISPAVTLADSANTKQTVPGTMTFPNGIVEIDCTCCASSKTDHDNKFAKSSRDSKVVSTTAKLVMKDSTVFTIVAADGIFTYTGIPADNYQLVLTANTLVIAATTDKVMIEDRTRSINQIAKGDVEYFGKFLKMDGSTWEKREITNTWAFNDNTNNCPQGFKWKVDAAYIVTSETELQTVTNENGVLYVYSKLYNLVSCKYEEVAFADTLLALNEVLVVDRILGYAKVAYADIFNVDNTDFLNGSNWSTDIYVGKFVSGSTIGYYEFATAGKFSVAPNFVIISTVTKNYTDGTTETVVVVSTAASDLRANASVTYTVANGVPTGYAVQAYTINNIVK